jgi:hypothetical protein
MYFIGLTPLLALPLILSHPGGRVGKLQSVKKPFSPERLSPGSCSETETHAPRSPRKALKRMLKVRRNHRILSARLPYGVSTARW